MTKRLSLLRRLKSSRVALLGAVSCLVLATCTPSVTTVATSELGEGPGGEGLLHSRSVPAPEAEVALGTAPVEGLAPPSLPADVPAEGAPPPPAPPPAAPEGEAPHFEPVTVQTPKLRLDGVPADRDDLLGQVLGVQGVTFATMLTVGEVAIAAPEGVTAVRVAAVDPFGFRVLTPQVTADAVEVWQRISEGDAAFIHEVGHRLQLELGQRIPAAGVTTLRVGALASNGAPPVADAIVSQATAQALQLQGTRSILISLAGDAAPANAAKRVQEATGIAPQVLEEPTTQRAFLSGAAARNAFEPFNYVSFGDGMIQIDSAWVRRNIVRANVPILRGEVLCHRLLIPQLRGALQEVQDRGLAHLIDPSQYGGCWVPRHVLFNPQRGLSMHAWGLAVDINVSTNGYGAVPQMDPRIVEVFDRWGFVWGGRWSIPDGMHFELGAILKNAG
ncbi:MAG TPA: M15 family metallopeptidase [Egibacteraceae bacterium]|jgi:hypothetical protein|nr:M15 family metallopeptidase [Egibacteraceae bacterium]